MYGAAAVAAYDSADDTIEEASDCGASAMVAARDFAEAATSCKSWAAAMLEMRARREMLMNCIMKVWCEKSDFS